MSVETGQDILDAFFALPEAEQEELVCKSHLGEWTRRRIGYQMTDLHWEWCELRMHSQRLAVVAPRDHAKSETFTVNGTAWESIYTPGLWTYIFAETMDQAKKMLRRTVDAVHSVAPWMVDGAIENNSESITFANFARIDVAGSGKAVRSVHPDVIIGDDVLSEKSTSTSLQRKRTEKWWFGVVGGMAHPGTDRLIGRGEDSRTIWMPPTRIYLVGTPFHQQDLLMGMKKNPVYRFRRYAAEYHEDQLVDGMAVEVG